MIPCTQLRWAMKKILMFLACFVFVAQVVFAAYVEVNPASGSSSAVTINKDELTVYKEDIIFQSKRIHKLQKTHFK